MRSVEEWHGASDDTVPPPRVRIRVWEKCLGRCGSCDRQIRAGETWTLEHVIALVNGGPNCESNLDITCKNCLSAKNAADVSLKSKIARTAKKHHLPKPLSRWGKGSKFKRKMDGTVVRR